MHRSHCNNRQDHLCFNTYQQGPYLLVGRIIALNDVHVLIPRTCDYGTLHNKRDLAGVIQRKILSWGDYHGLSRGAQCNHREKEGKVTEGDVTTKVR